ILQPSGALAVRSPHGGPSHQQLARQRPAPCPDPGHAQPGRFPGRLRWERGAVRGPWPSREYRISDVRGDISIELKGRTIPEAFKVITMNPAPQEYSFTLERVGSGEKVTISDLFIPLQWRYRWYAYEPHSVLPHLAPTESAWNKATAS